MHRIFILLRALTYLLKFVFMNIIELDDKEYQNKFLSRTRRGQQTFSISKSEILLKRSIPYMNFFKQNFNR